MNIITTPDELKNLYYERGRPPTYPFYELNPDETLVLDNCKKIDLGRVRSALYQFKKNNNLDWQTMVRMNENTIYVSRIS